MVSPAARRAAVTMAQERFGISQRRACLIVGAHRSTHRRKVPFHSEEEFLRRRIRTMALRYPRYGYRRIHAILIREGYLINRKRVQRLWRLEGLHVPVRKARKPRKRRNPGAVKASYPHHVWAIDFQFDETADGRPVKILNVSDEFTRQSLACAASRSLTAATTVAILDHIRGEMGHTPAYLRMDNGPEFIAELLQDWCTDSQIKATYIDPGSPWQNGYIESFNSRLRDELLSREIFDSMWEIRMMLEDHRQNYNHYRPHSSLGYLTPVEFAKRWQRDNKLLVS